MSTKQISKKPLLLWFVNISKGHKCLYKCSMLGMMLVLHSSLHISGKPSPIAASIILSLTICPQAPMMLSSFTIQISKRNISWYCATVKTRPNVYRCDRARLTGRIWHTKYSYSGRTLKLCITFVPIMRTSKHFWLLQYIWHQTMVIYPWSITTCSHWNHCLWSQELWEHKF